MSKEKVVLDANVLYSYFSRDLLLSLFVTGFYEAKWTDSITGEWVEHLLKNNKELDRKKIERTVDLMQLIKPNPLVENFEHLIAKLELPDPKDRHVLAAAITSKASRIVTWNLKDFPKHLLSEFGISAQDPDRFIETLIIEDPNPVVKTLREMRQRLKKPPMNIDEFFEALERNNLNRTRAVLDKFRASL